MTSSPDNFTKPPHRVTPQEKLRRPIARGRQRDASHERRPVPPIVAETTYRCDARSTLTAAGTIPVSLPRLNFLRGPRS
ncbi:hypothetical protein [Methylosinus sp. LW4]|uniref:hypothetical protein n=1 Tax=Methylosinus sp. LW4 TaxID=136993 RepID=UPI00036843E1|nr:hypothetical protein [Methylosinus sp. LW4]